MLRPGNDSPSVSATTTPDAAVLLSYFNIERRIGKGQFSEVYRAVDSRTGAIVALKKIAVCPCAHTPT